MHPSYFWANFRGLFLCEFQWIGRRRKNKSTPNCFKGRNQIKKQSYLNGKLITKAVKIGMLARELLKLFKFRAHFT